MAPSSFMQMICDAVEQGEPWPIRLNQGDVLSLKGLRAGVSSEGKRSIDTIIDGIEKYKEIELYAEY